MRVLFILSGGEEKASTRYRMLNLLPYLDDTDIEYDVFQLEISTIFNSRLLDKTRIAFQMIKQARHYDLVYLQKVSLPPAYLRTLGRVCDQLVFDFDDGFYAKPPWSNRDIEQRRDRLNAAIKTASAVVTGSPILSNYARQLNDDIYCLPTSIPREPYESLNDSTDNNDDQVTLGWIGNQENLWYLSQFEDAIETVLDRFEDAHLLIITSNDRPTTPLSNRRGNDVTYREWGLNTALDELNEADIGIRPLTDDKFTRGKGGFTSVIQCMALSLPVVVTPVSMLADIIEHGENGFHATTDDEWVKYLSTLIEDREKRSQMGKQAFQSVGEQGFWLDQRAEEFINTLNSIKQSS